MIAARLRALAAPSAAALHKLRRALSRELAAREGGSVIAIAERLLAMRDVPGRRMIACALVGHHPAALACLDARTLERFGAGLQGWGDVDIFACLLAGRAWRDGSIADRVMQRWTRSEDRWWRRAALVSTVPLNVRAQGGRGDTRRTLDICARLTGDRDDMVAKALSWALRELVVHDRAAVADFLETHDAVLAARVKREVRNKLSTGLKQPTSRNARGGVGGRVHGEVRGR